ncbi:MAG: glutaredoxin domain-containing protein [Candidatus Bathyarchaeota archaeon]
MKIEIYTSSTCPNCKALKTRLAEAKVEFTEKNTDIDSIRLELYTVGRCTVPSIISIDEDGVKRALEDDEIDKMISV